MKRVLLSLVVVFMVIATATAKTTWMEKGTVTGSITRVQNDTVIEREFTLITDGTRTRYNVHFVTEGYEDYSQLRTPIENRTMAPDAGYFQVNGVTGMDYTNSILQAGLNDGRTAELGDNGLPKLVYDENVTWRYTSWKPNVVDYSQLSLVPRSEDMVEYFVPGGNGMSLLYTNTSDLDVDSLLAAKIAGPANCAAGSIAAMAISLGVDVDLSGLVVDEDGNTKLSDVAKTLRDAGIDVKAASLMVTSLSEDDIALVMFPGSKHLVMVTKVTEAGAWMVDMTNRRFLGYVPNGKLNDTFAEPSLALVVSESVVASNDRLIAGVSVAGHECNNRVQEFHVFNCPSFCTIPGMNYACGWVHERWRCGDGVGTCYNRSVLPTITGAPCYVHPYYGCIGDWSQELTMYGYDFCG